ncbi:3-deoxy-manno-octulosonate cytidylyltransferase [Alienimonas chondri]|uniref:3-deoxy-manno-octulosonate cytidylyltransferase n=1 Tax=Alienimonas chondri TaxID=2681879 RepID=A0ABX1V9I8_9PLAN|nr:3-deoxy-manno-octulosonate cytidylyltransferase [Alienimonas chondri]NNJ24759.1 3-deoxy-manno-octulosonate cytidylyltransferase [Alienimonas chondri]
MPVLGVIPARLQSARLPEKLLLRETGRSLLEHTYRAASHATSLDELVVATDSPEIAAEVKRFGGVVEMTGEHPSGTDRLAEVARRRNEFDVLVNVQGDEPEIDPAAIDLLAAAVRDTDAEMATLCSPMTDLDAFRDPANVKVVCDPTGRALYFSRSPIPHPRDAAEHPGGVPENARLHIGAYSYRRDFLIRLSELPPSRLERVEKLEQLRALEAGCTLRVCEVAAHACGVDTRADYNAFVARFHARETRPAP